MTEKLWSYIKETPRNTLFKQAFLLSLVFHILAIFFSEGFHRPDEHLGIIRLMSFKLGDFPKDQLSWEYGAMIRPWLQPYGFYLISQLLNSFGITNPFIISGILRLFCSVIGFYATYRFTLYSFKYVKTKLSQKIIVILMATMWYLPFFHARTSAENLSLSFFIFGLINIDSDDQKVSNFIKAGLFFSISYILRFQSGVMVMFAMLWPLFNKKINLINFFISTLVLFFFIAISSIIDFVGYEKWTFTSWNYVYYNIFKGVASGFGESPWYYYFEKSITKGIPPYSIFLVFSLMWLWIKRAKSYLTWMTLPFIIIHSLIGHKELRFIFGIGIFAPVAIAIFIESCKKELLIKKWSKIIILLALLGNMGGLFISSTKPAYTPIKFYKHLYNKKVQIKDLYTLSYINDELLYYQKEAFNQIYIRDELQDQFLLDLNRLDDEKWIFTSNFSYILELEKISNCKRDYSSYPSFLLDKKFKKLFKRSKIWTLYHCKSSL